MFKLIVNGNRLLRFIQQRQDRTIHLSRHQKVAVWKVGHRQQRAEFVLGGIFNNDDAAFVGHREKLWRWLLVVELIRPGTAGPNDASTVDEEYFCQAAIDLPLHDLDGLAHVAIIHKEVGAAFVVEISGQGATVTLKLVALFCFICFGGVERRAQNGGDAVRKPALKTHIDRQERKDRDQNRRDQRQKHKRAGKPEVQLRSGGAVAPCNGQPRDPLDHQSRDQENINNIRKQDQPEGRGIRAAFQRSADHSRGQYSQDRPKENKANRDPVLHGSDTPPTAHVPHIQTKKGTRHCVSPLVFDQVSLLTACFMWSLPKGMFLWGHGYVAILHQFAAACHANIEFGDLLSERISVDPKQIRAFGLISACGVEADLNQRALNLP